MPPESKPFNRGEGHPKRRNGFTMVEMMIVVAVILLVLGLALPAAQTMWEQRKLINAQNVVQGMLATARAKAIQGDNSENGLFFYIDEQEKQRIVPIKQVDATQLIIKLIEKGFLRATTLPPEYILTLSHVFEVAQDRGYTLSAPVRAVPRYAVEDKFTSPDKEAYELFSVSELVSNDFYDPSDDADNVQRHRNFFTMIFSTEGHLRVNRDVLILDLDEDENNLGDLTDLYIGYDHNSNISNVKNYYNPSGPPGSTLPIDPDKFKAVPFLLVDDIDDPIAINFPSVDGLLVYDDLLFNQAGTEKEKRNMLLRTAQPMYVNRWTGSVIMGPIGENALP